DGCGKPLPALATGFFERSFTTFFDAAFDFALVFVFVLALALAFFAMSLSLVSENYFFLLSALCGLRLPMRPLSLPAPGSSTALISVGLPLSIASLTARRSSSGDVALTPTPPKASIILS